MASPQVQGPPPTITEVVSSNGSLLVKWEQDVYGSNSDDATLLYIDQNENVMYSVLLNTQQILEDQYLLTGLVNGHSYACLFSCLYDDQTTHNSNTVIGIPSDVPNAPTINSYSLVPPSYNTLNVNVTLGSNGGANIDSVVFRVYDQSTHVITTQAFVPVNDGNYVLSNLVANHIYCISCQAQNIAGYSLVSNSVSFSNAPVPSAPVLAEINSGSNASVSLNVSGNNSSPNAIDKFIVQYKLSSADNWTPHEYTPTGMLDASYNVVIPINNLANASVGYIFKVAAHNVAGYSMYSAEQNAEPAVQLSFSNLVITFPASNQIQATWNRNASSWSTSGYTNVVFSGTTSYGPFDFTMSLQNSGSPVSATYTLPAGQYLVTGSSYSVLVNGYTIVPQNIYGTYWVIPILDDLQFPAVSVSGSVSYATVPGPVTNITYLTDIDNNVQSPNNGNIQFFWIEADDNGSPIINYVCQLYTVSQGIRTPLGDPIITNAENCLFSGLNTSLYYAIGIIATNAVGDGPPVYCPTTNTGIQILDAVPSVTNLRATQTNYSTSPVQFDGLLAWNYTGPGVGYSGNTYFDVYSVSPLGVQVKLDSVLYVAGISSYSYVLDLGDIPNKTFNYAVQVRATNPSSLSVKIYASVTTGIAPIISDVVVAGTSGQPSTWTLTFKVTNPTSSPMIQNSILALVMPNPVSDVQNVNPIFMFDQTLVASPGSHIYVQNLGYEAISDDYVLITAANGNGNSIYRNGWAN